MKIQNMIQAKLEQLEKQTPEFYKMTPYDLQVATGVPEHYWSEYLQQEQVRQRITAKMNEEIEISHRKAINALAIQAQNGNVQAIKELNQLSGIMNQNNNKQIVTHYIPRPRQTQTKTRENRIKEIMKEQDWGKEDAEEWYDYNEATPIEEDEE